MELEKVKSILEWLVVKDMVDITSFIWIAGYYHIFIEQFPRIKHPITSWQKKGVKFKWTQKCQENFERLKNLLIVVPILQIKNPCKEFVVCTNSFLEGLGGMLMQEGIVIAYESQKVEEDEKNYVVHEL